MPGPGSGAPVQLFSDLLLHDMGPTLADRFEQGSASGREFRTMPLWRVSDRPHFLHDGRASTIADAILDRLVHNAHRLTLKGQSMRKTAAKRAGLDVKQDA